MMRAASDSFVERWLAFHENVEKYGGATPAAAPRVRSAGFSPFVSGRPLRRLLLAAWLVDRLSGRVTLRAGVVRSLAAVAGTEVGIGKCRRGRRSRCERHRKQRQGELSPHRLTSFRGFAMSAPPGGEALPPNEKRGTGMEWAVFLSSPL